VVRNYASDNTWTWDTTGAPATGYEILVNVRRAGTAGPDASASIPYTLTVVAANQPPVARDDAASTAMNVPVVVNVVSNDTDDVGVDASSVQVVSPPSNGTSVPGGSGSVTYTPGEAFTGVDVFTYIVSDGQGAVSNVATVTVTVVAGNQPPVARDDAASTAVNVAVAVNVVSNDTDDVGVDVASVQVVNLPLNGTAVPDGSGSVTYTPSGGFAGVDAFTYRVSDGQGIVSNTATVTVTVATGSVEAIIDNGHPGTSSTGVWDISGASDPYGSNSVWSRDGSQYTWGFTPSVSGNYDVSMWWTTWPSRSASVPVDIAHAGGTSRVTVNQQANGGKWNALGSYTLAGGVSYTVTVTSQPGPSSTCADAVKFSSLGGSSNLPPGATIDSIDPNPARPGETVYFAGHGDDPDGGTIAAYNWRSSIDGLLSSSASFSTSQLSDGIHSIFFRVQDDKGAWSKEESASLAVMTQSSNVEHIYLILIYNAWRELYVERIEAMGAVPEGNSWKYTNASLGKTYYIHIVEDMDSARNALYSENAHVILTGHSNYGMGGIFKKPDESLGLIEDLYYIDDVRMWAYSSPWVGVSVRGMIGSQAYPNWWPEFQDGTSGIMPYDFGDPRGDPPYNYYIRYRVPGDPTYYRVESVHNSAPERFPGSGAAPWFSQDGNVPTPTNPDHRQYYITNTDTSGNYGTCGSRPCPKSHYSGRTIVFRKDLEVDVSRLRYKRLMVDTCTSANYYLDTFQRGIVFFTKENTDGNGTFIYLENYLKGRSDEELWALLGAYQGIFDYYDFNKRPSEQ
jgi:hypothetical protein